MQTDVSCSENDAKKMMSVEQPRNDNTVSLSTEEWYHLCSQRPDAFGHHYFGHMLRFKSSELHFLLYDLIKRIPEVPYSINAAIAAPRGNAKTVIMSVVLPIWCAALQKKKFIILIGETSRTAEANLESIQHELTTNEQLMEDFPEICGEGPIWRKDAIETNNGVRITALGSGKAMRGALFKGGVRPDLILNDDIDSEKNCSTVEQRDKHEEWFTRVVLGLVGAGAKMDTIVCGTIIHSKSLLNKLLDTSDYPGWEKYKFKAIETFSDSPLWDEWQSIFTDGNNPTAIQDSRNFFDLHKVEMLAGTKVLWPEGDSYLNLMEWRIRNGARAFAAEKMNNPLDPSLRAFDPDLITYYQDDEIKWDEIDVYGAVDPASGKAKKHGDNTAVTTLAKNKKTGIMYVLDSYIREVPISEAVTHIKAMDKVYGYRKFGVDSDALKLLKDFLLQHIPGLNIILYDLRLKKSYRLQRLEPLMRTGMIRFKKSHKKLMEEIELYPQSDHDDGLDSLEIAVRLAGTRGYRLLTY